MAARRRKAAFMCGVDWQHELGEAPGGIPLYASVKDIKHHRTCTKSCGIIRVEVSPGRWMLKQHLGSGYAHQLSKAEERAEMIDVLVKRLGWHLSEAPIAQRRMLMRGIPEGVKQELDAALNFKQGRKKR